MVHAQLIKQNMLLQSMGEMHIRFLDKGIEYGWCDEILEDLLNLSESNFGFICELLHRENDTPFVRSHGISNISWSEETRAYYEKSKKVGLEFENLDSLWGEVIVTGAPVIANDPETDPRRGGYPKSDGHPEMKTLLCLPIKDPDGDVVGVMAVANRIEGYDKSLIEFLAPFVTTYGVLIASTRKDKAQESDLVLDSKKLSIAFKEKKQFLSRTEFKVLNVLYARPSVIYSREQIIQYALNECRDVSDRAIDAHIKNLRKKLKELNPDKKYIATVRGAGYKFNP